MILRSKLQFIEIEKVEPFGNLTKNNAMQLHDYLNVCIDEGRYCQLVDFKHVIEIDDIGVKIFAEFKDSKLYMALFNVKPKVLTSLKIPVNTRNIKIFNENDSVKVASLISQELLLNLTKPIFEPSY